MLGAQIMPKNMYQSSRSGNLGERRGQPGHPLLLDSAGSQGGLALELLVLTHHLEEPSVCIMACGEAVGRREAEAKRSDCHKSAVRLVYLPS